MSEHSRDITDEDLPEELRPAEDNPLAQPLDEDDEQTRSLEELDMQGGKAPAESGDSDEADAAG